jgi:hypothetical protein
MQPLWLPEDMNIEKSFVNAAQLRTRPFLCDPNTVFFSLSLLLLQKRHFQLPECRLIPVEWLKNEWINLISSYNDE